MEPPFEILEVSQPKECLIVGLIRQPLGVMAKARIGDHRPDTKRRILPRQHPVYVRAPRRPVGAVVFDLNGHEKGADIPDFWYRDEIDAPVTLICCTSELDIISHTVDALSDHVLKSFRRKGAQFARTV